MEEIYEESNGTTVSSVEVPFQEEQRSIIQMAPPASTTPTKDKETNKTKTPEAKSNRKMNNCTTEGCNYSTPYSKDLQRHMRKHTGEKPFSCDRCHKSYSRYDKLVNHIRVHDGHRPHKCTLCNYASVDSSSLRKHQRIHTDERPFKCQICPYAARESSQLVVHLRMHTGDSPYFCMEDGCDAAFKTPSDLQRHIRLHTGEKPYSCPHCPYRAAVKSNLNVHLRKHQDVEEEQLTSNDVPLENLPSSSTNIKSEEIINEEIMMDTGTSSVNSNSARDDQDCMNNNTSESNLTISGSETSDHIEESSEISSSSTVIISPSEIVHAELSEPPPEDTLMQTTQFNLPVVKKSIKPKKTYQRKKDITHSSSLPFQYACKQCPHKADTLKLFGVHMKKVHDESDTSYLKCQTLRITGGRKVGRPRPTRRTKHPQTSAVNELEKFYDCSLCSASFVREDSLRCHMRQHTDPPQVTLRQGQQQGQTLRLEESVSISNEQPSEGILFTPSHHFFIVSSSGTGTIQSDDFQFHSTSLN